MERRLQGPHPRVSRWPGGAWRLLRQAPFTRYEES